MHLSRRDLLAGSAAALTAAALPAHLPTPPSLPAAARAATQPGWAPRQAVKFGMIGLPGSLADKFAGLDADKDGKLTREELRAGKHGKRGEGRHGGEGRGEGKGWHDKDPAERAAKMMEKRDADKNGALSPTEVAGSRLAEKFAEVDADKNGALSKDELVAFKAAHHGRGPAPK